MSTRDFTSTSLPLVAVLLGALAFNLSSWPTSPLQKVQAADLSSQMQSCVQEKLEQGDLAECRIDDEVVSGSVTAEYVERDVRNRDADMPNATKKERGFEIAVCMQPRDPSLSDGATVVKLEEACKNKVRVSTVAQAAAKVLEITTAQKAEIEKRIAAKKEETAKRERCEINADGKEITDDSEIIKCKMARTRSMKAEEAAEYYDQEIQPKLQEMLSCGSNDPYAGLGGLSSLSAQMGRLGGNSVDRKCEAQRTKAMRLLQSLSTGYGRNPYISQSLRDLKVFGLYNKQVDELMVLGNLPANDPRRRMAGQQLQQLQQSWGVYLNQRGLALNNARSPLGWDNFSLAGGLTDDLSGYGTDLNASFLRVAQLHQQYLAATGQTGNSVTGASTVVASGSNPRQSRGMPSTSYAGGPNGNTQLNRQMPVQQGRGGVQPMSTNRTNSNGLMKPQLGDRVR